MTDDDTVEVSVWIVPGTTAPTSDEVEAYFQSGAIPEESYQVAWGHDGFIRYEEQVYKVRPKPA
jgi:hypothetical protein